MISVDGYKAFRGTMRITPVNPKFPTVEAHGDWLYKPEYKCWYGRVAEYGPFVSSFGENICEVVEDETE